MQRNEWKEIKKFYHEWTTKANIVNSQFSSVFTSEDLSNMPDMGVSSTQYSMHKRYQIPLIMHYGSFRSYYLFAPNMKQALPGKLAKLITN